MGGQEELIALPHSSRGVGEDRCCGPCDQGRHALPYILGGRRGFQCCHEYAQESEERVAVVGVDPRHVLQHKVQQRPPRAYRAVSISHDVDGCFSLPCGGLLAEHLGMHCLGGVEGRDENVVLEHIALRCPQRPHHILLQSRQRDHSLVLFPDQRRPLILELRALEAGHEGEDLLLQPRLGDSEIDKTRLRLQLRAKVGIGQLGLDVEPEVPVQLHLLISHHDPHLAPGAAECAGGERFE
mmetsp:Transcript_65500/g.207036  ORF Transcript_65500/g.207036 Transcript_65500/m.207036 type:complete len:240 (+) Transcript_65500:1750-2469(+)